jgi:hypothetical protein
VGIGISIDIYGIHHLIPIPGHSGTGLIPASVISFHSDTGLT